MFNLDSSLAKASLEAKLFDVVDVPVEAPTHLVDQFGMPIDCDNPKTQLVYRTDTGQHLGTTRNSYKSLQPTEFLDAVWNSLLAIDGVDMENIEYQDWGSRIAFRVHLGKKSFINSAGQEDERDNFLEFRTGFGGNTKTSVGTYEYRQICSNGMMGWDFTQAFTAKHTQRMNNKAILFISEIHKVVESIKQVDDLYTELNKIEVTSKQVDAFARTMVGADLNAKRDEVPTQTWNRLEDLLESLAIELPRSGSTAYGLLQGATHYTNHSHKLASNEFISVGTGAKFNSKAQSLVLDMVA
jgi:hypothetical protein